MVLKNISIRIKYILQPLEGLFHWQKKKKQNILVSSQ